MKLTINHILEATGGRLEGGYGAKGEGPAGAVSIDSRSISGGEVFLALRGPRFDGHAFVARAAKKGAVCAVVESADGLNCPSSFDLVVVGSTRKALGDLASYVRRLHTIPLVALSGSSGKTTTKEMIAAILERSRRILKTEGNMNNQVGLPLTLLGLEPFHEAAVVELGISEASEMERLVEISAPDVALITNIGSGHLETLGTMEGVARAKGPLFTAPGPGCVRVVNLDDPLVRKLAAESPASGGTVTYGTDSGADVVVTKHMVPGDLKGIDVVYEVRGVSVDVRFTSPAVCNAINGAAAIAATLALGSSIEDIREGLRSFATPPGRMEVLRAGSLTLLDDTYNANPESVEAALKTLSTVSGRKVAVLGEMLELGHASAMAHRDAGRVAGDLGVDLLVAIGPLSRETAEGGISSGLDAASVYSFDDKEAALKALKGLVKAGDSVLVKGSRGAALEEVVRALKNMAELGNAYG